MTDRVRVGVVGLGHNGLAHLEAHLKNPHAQVAALCDRNENLLRAVGAKYGIARLYRDDAIFADPRIDAITIHTGDNDHRDPFLAAIRHGKHVLVEKPLANTEQDVGAMVEAARGRTELKIQVGYILRFNAVFEAVRDLARTGRLGEIYYMEGDYIHNLLYQRGQTDPVTGRNWYLEHERPMVGGGGHPLDLMRWISGKEVVRVTGFSNHAAFPEMAHDDCQVALFQFADGAIAKTAALYGPRRAMAPYYNLRVYGTLGTIERDQAALPAGAGDVHPPLEPISAPRPGGHPYDPEIADWLEAILQDRPTRTGLRDGANSTMATLCACRAMAGNRAVDVPVFPA